MAFLFSYTHIWRDAGQSAEASKRIILGSKVFVQAFTLTFLAEWGDRSQIATIILGAREDPVGVTLGGILGHSICTFIAVMGGRIVAQRISVRTGKASQFSWPEKVRSVHSQDSSLALFFLSAFCFMSASSMSALVDGPRQSTRHLRNIRSQSRSLAARCFCSLPCRACCWRVTSLGRLRLTCRVPCRA